MKRIPVLLMLILPLSVSSCSCGGKHGGGGASRDYTITTNGGSDNQGWEETALSATALPPVQINVANDSRSWIFANMLRANEAWILLDGGNPSSADADAIAASLPVRADGWPAGLPAGYTLSFPRWGYPTGMAVNPEDNEEHETFLHGVWVLTWEGTGTVDMTASESNGIGYETLLSDTDNRRIVMKISDPFKFPMVFVRASDASDPVRGMKLWAPVSDGAGLDLTASSNLSAGSIAGSLEPAPGAAEPLFHPVFLNHLRQAGSGNVYRMMSFLNINQETWTTDELGWDDRGDPSYAFGSLSLPDSGWTRHPVAGYRQQLGVPYEWLIEICNQTGNDLWIQVPHVANEELIRGLARLIYDKLDVSLRVWFEFSNEIWNGYGPYMPQFSLATDVAAKHFGVAAADVTTEQRGWGAGHLQAWALSIFEDEWAKCGGTDGRLVNVVAGFAMGSAYNRAQLAAVKEIHPALPETLAISNYFGYEPTREIFALQDWSKSDGVTWSDSLLSQTKGAIRRNLYETYAAWAANAQVAKDEGVHLISYEGGQHLLCVGLGESSNPDFQPFMKYISWLQRSDIMKDFYTEHYALWSAAGGRTVSLFVDIGAHSYWGYWGAKEWVNESSKKWESFLSWISSMNGVRAVGEPLSGSAPSLEDASLKAEAGTAFTASISGGSTAASVQMIGGELPAGLSFTPGTSNATISGTPTASSSSRIIVRALDADKDPSYRIYTISVDPQGMSANAILRFSGADIPSTVQSGGSYNGRYDSVRAYETWGTTGHTLGVPFSIDEGSALFGPEYADGTTAGNNTIPASSQCNMYGGWCISQLGTDQTMVASTFTSLRSHEFQSWSGVNSDGIVIPSAVDIFLAWKKDQFSGGTAPTYSFGSSAASSTMRVDFTNVIADGVNEMRFAVLDGSTWYLSEKAYTENYVGDGYFEITGFSGSSSEGRRWAVIDPQPQSFAIPAASALTFSAHSFSDIRAVGLLYHGRREGYHYMFSFGRFAVLGSSTN